MGVLLGSHLNGICLREKKDLLNRLWNSSSRAWVLCHKIWRTLRCSLVVGMLHLWVKMFHLLISSTVAKQSFIALPQCFFLLFCYLCVLKKGRRKTDKVLLAFMQTLCRPGLRPFDGIKIGIHQKIQTVYTGTDRNRFSVFCDIRWSISLKCGHNCWCWHNKAQYDHFPVLERAHWWHRQPIVMGKTTFKLLI